MQLIIQPSEFRSEFGKSTWVKVVSQKILLDPPVTSLTCQRYKCFSQMTDSFVENFVLFSFPTKCFNALELAYVSTYFQNFHEQNNKETKLKG